MRPAPITAMVSDFGGVLTTPLLDSFAAFQDETGISVEALGKAIQTAAESDGVHPLYELEVGRLTEAEFLDRISTALEPQLGERPTLHAFREIYFDALKPNEPMISLMREVKASGRQMALLTNNVREWEPLWRAMLPVDEIFELVVDSAFVGMRKPDPPIYELTIARLGGTDPESCVFVDDLSANVEAARGFGMTGIHFRSNEQAIPEIRAVLGLPG